MATISSNTSGHVGCRDDNVHVLEDAPMLIRHDDARVLSNSLEVIDRLQVMAWLQDESTT
jgi:hypothetical protein